VHCYERFTDWLKIRKLHTLILLNMGAILDLSSESWFGEFSMKLTVHIIDSTRPQNLANMFSVGENGERFIVWDDGEAENMGEERKAWEALMVNVTIITL
jgi:cell division control protein 45